MVNKLLIVSFLISLTLCMLPPEEIEEPILKTSILEARNQVNTYVKNMCLGQASQHISDSDIYVKRFTNNGNPEFLQDYIQRTTIANALKLKKLPEKLIKIMTTMDFSKEGYANDIDFILENNDTSSYTVQKYIGAAFRFENYVFYGLYYASVSASFNEFYEQVKRTETKRNWYCLFLCTKTTVYYEKVKRGPTGYEMEQVKKELEARALDLIKTKTY